MTGYFFLNYCYRQSSINKVSLLLAAILLTACAAKPAPEPAFTPPARQDLLDVNVRGFTVPDVKPPKSEAQALERAKNEERVGSLEKSLYAYIQALDFNPKNASTLYHIGRIHLLKGNLNIALKAYNEALAINSNLLMIHADLGILAMDMRQYAQARTHLEKAVTIDQQRLTSALTVDIAKTHKVLVKLDPQSPARVYNALAILEDIENSHDKAKQYFQLILAREPHSAVILTNLGYSYYLSGDIVQAEHFFRKAIQSDPKFERSWTNLGLVYVRQGLYNKALATFEQTMSEADALNDLGYFLMLEGKNKEAVRLFERAINASPSYFEQAQKNLKRAQAELNDEFQQVQH